MELINTFTYISNIKINIFIFLFFCLLTYLILNDFLIYNQVSKDITENVIFNIINGTFDDNLNIRDPKTYLNNRTKTFLINLVKNATKYCHKM
jgi:hypothetical protein